MRDNILESIFLDTALWAETITHGVDKHIAHDCLEKFADPHVRADLCVSIAEGEYKIQPPHTGYKKKDDGGERMFLANEPKDRVLLNIIYKWLMRNEGKMIHPSCKSYQEGIGIGKIVKQVAKLIRSNNSGDTQRIVGRKFDIHKYFDTIGREYIHKALSAVVEDFGESSVIDLLRDYYDSDLYYDTRQHAMVEGYQGIKQGCAVSAWLANVLLYKLDEELSSRGGLYVRYSDDIIYIGEDYEEATQVIRQRLAEVGLSLNEKKVSDIVVDQYFCFLGFEIHGSDITLSRKWVKHFQQEIDKRTVCNVPLIKKVRSIRQKGGDKQEERLKRLLMQATRNIARYLLYGNGRFSWATEVLPTVNNRSDLKQLTTYSLDALRAVYTGHTHIGGLGKSPHQGIQRGKGRHVRTNRAATAHLEDSEQGLHFLSLFAVKKAISNKWLFCTLAANMVDNYRHPLYGQATKADSSRKEVINQLETLYAKYLHSRPNEGGVMRFHAYNLEEMSMEDLIMGGNRNEALFELEQFLVNQVDFSILQDFSKSWYWQSEVYPQLVLLKEWFIDHEQTEHIADL